jgi:ATP/ADP translocase/HEAT repeat protein
MLIRQRIRSALGVRSSEVSRVSWLVAHSLFVGVFSAFFLTAANALFLDRFEISYLPLAYIAAGVLGYVALMLFSRAQKAVSVQRLLVANLAVLLILTAGFWLLTVATGSRWVVFLMFAWVGPAFGLVSLGYWALASRLFDLRQGKRLFGLVGAGEEVATVAALFSVPLLLRYLDGPIGLLPLAAAGLVGCLIVVLAITRRLGETLDAGDEDRRAAGAENRIGLRDLVRHRYFVLMAGLIIFLSLANYIVDFGFLAEVRSRFEGPTQIAQFIGVFFGVTKVLELILKVFLSGRLLSQFGLKLGLMLLPGLLAIVAGLAILIGTLGLAATHFFVLIALAKLVWVVMRTSTFEPTFRVLYQPVPAVDRLSFQTHVEGTAKQLATGFVGVALLVFSRGGSFDALYLFYALVPILAAWMAVNVLAHRDYRAKLMESLSLRKRDEPTETPLDVLEPELHSEDPRTNEIGLDLLDKLEDGDVDRALTGMLSDPRPGVRVAALEHIGRTLRIDLMDAVSGATGETDASVRSAARGTLERLQEVHQLGGDPGRIEERAGSTEPRDRALAATAIGRGSGPGGDPLSSLLFDRDWSVRRCALEAAGRRGRTDFLPQIVADLPSPAFASTAAAALVRLGTPALGEVEKAFNKADLSLGVRERILRIYEGIGGEESQGLLLNKLTFPERAVRRQALVALNRTGFQANLEQAPVVERAIEAEAAGAAWNMSAVLDLSVEKGLAKIREALQEEIRQGRSRLYGLLSLLHDPAAIGLVKKNIESGSSEATVYALEIMDLLISPELKPLVFPLIEDLAYPQVLRRLEVSFPRQRLEPLDRLSLIVNRDYDRIGTWTRACAVEAVGELSPEIVPDLVASLFHPNPMISEVAARTMLGLNAGGYRRHRGTLPYEAREHLDYVVGPEGDLAHWESRSIFGRAQLLRELPAFSTLSSEALVELATASDERVLKPHRRLPSPRAPRESFYVLVDGELGLVDEGAAPNGTGPGARSLIAFGPGARTLKVIETARFIRLEPDPLMDAAAEHVELIPALLQAIKLSIEPGLGPQGPPEGPAPEPIEMRVSP